jgi:hypothetical protein
LYCFVCLSSLSNARCCQYLWIAHPLWIAFAVFANAYLYTLDTGIQVCNSILVQS